MSGREMPGGALSGPLAAASAPSGEPPSTWLWVLLGAVLVAVFVGAGVGIYNLLKRSSRPKVRTRLTLLSIAFVVGAVLSVAWWLAASGWEPADTVRYLNISLTSWALGALFGFLFASYSRPKGDPATGGAALSSSEASLGKIRDWLIGGISGLGVVEIASGSKHLQAFVELFSGTTDPEGSMYAMFIVYFIAGFLIMFLVRRLGLNLLLVTEDINLANLQEQATGVKPVLERAGRSRPLTHIDMPEAAAVPEELESEHVEKFLANAAEASDALDATTAWKVAQTRFFRNEFSEALPHLQRSREVPDYHVKATGMLAYAMGELGRHGQSVKLLEELDRRGLASADMYKLLGYHLLWDPKRLEDSIRFTEQYLAERPDDAGAIFNLACAHSQLFGQTADNQHQKQALEHLRRAVALAPYLRKRALGLTAKDQDFEPLKDNERFVDLVEQ